MPKPMTKADIIAHLASKFNLNKRLVAKILDEMASLALREARNTFTLPGIGKLVLVQRKARLGRNPATGEQISIPAKRVLKFRVALAAKRAIIIDDRDSMGPKTDITGRHIVVRTDSTGPKIVDRTDSTGPKIVAGTDTTGPREKAKRIKGKA